VQIELVRGDITREQVDAVVNAANTGLRGGGGVDGAIHRAAGPTLAEECRKIRDRQGGCPTGEAVITSAGNMVATYVIHTPGPVWRGGDNGETELLRNCYANCLRVAEENGVTTIAFPSISTGVYRYPIEQAVKIAFAAVQEHAITAQQVQLVRFVLFSDHDYQVYANEHRSRCL